MQEEKHSMTIELSKEEKIQIINSHKRNLAFNKYNLEIDILQENAKTSPNTSVVSNIETQIAEITNQITALEAELTSVSAA